MLIEFIFNFMNRKTGALVIFTDLRKVLTQSIMSSRCINFIEMVYELTFIISYYLAEGSEIVCDGQHRCASGFNIGSTFLFHFNDLNNVSKILSCLLLADDTTLFLFWGNCQNLVRVANAELGGVSKWTKANMLFLFCG